MTYVINLARRIGINTYDTFVIEVTKSEDDFRQHLINMQKTFKRCGYFVKVEKHIKDDFVNAYITVETKIAC